MKAAQLHLLLCMLGIIRWFWTICYLPVLGVAAQKWCGKNYHIGEPVVPPKGAFHHNNREIHPFRCLPRVQPYLEGEDCLSASLLLDFNTTLLEMFNLASYSPKAILGSVQVTVQGYRHSYHHVELGSALELPFSICELVPRRRPFNLTCTLELELAYSATKSFEYSTSLAFLPQHPHASVTKLDRKTGALMTRSAGGKLEPIFPIGFFTNFGGYLARNLTILDELKAQGFNTVHPVPPFNDADVFQAVLDRMQALGLYLMYDMRHSYQNIAELSEEVTAMASYPNLLLWYTADEPDGPGDPLQAARIAYEFIYDLDGYHPVSISLNCDDHFFEEYVSGADIILPDIYMIGNNATFSPKYQTECTKDFGCCGCDNCQGDFGDLSKRMDDAAYRLRVLGQDKTKFVWAVTQAFGGEEFWSRPPNGKEWLVQALMSINHGARGIIPWIDPTPDAIKHYASNIAKILPRISTFLFDIDASFARLGHDSLDLGKWSSRSEELFIVVNPTHDRIDTAFRFPTKGRINWLLQDGVQISRSGSSSFEPLGSGVFVISSDVEGVLHDEL